MQNREFIKGFISEWILRLDCLLKLWWCWTGKSNFITSNLLWFVKSGRSLSRTLASGRRFLTLHIANSWCYRTKKRGIGIRVIQWWLASKYSIALLLWTEPVVGFLHCWLIYCCRCSRSLSKNNRINICWVGSKIALYLFESLCWKRESSLYFHG